MTIPSTARKAGPFDGTGVQTEWPFTFKVFTETDVKVVIADEFGVTTELVYLTDFTVELNADQESTPGGTVTYPISGAPLPDDGSVLSIIGSASYEQALDLPSGGNFSPLAIENALDAIVMQIQQLAEEISRAARLPVTSAEDAASLVADIVVLADNVSNMQTLVSNISDIVTVADDLNEPVSEINTVAGSIANVNTVGNNITNVNTVAGISANVTTVAGIQTNVTTVAGIQANVTTVAGIAPNVTTVAGIDTEVTTVAGISSDVSAVAAIDNDVSAVAAIDADVVAVAADATDIGLVAGSIGNVNIVAADLAEPVSEINTVATNIADVNTVGADIANVNAVAADIANIDIVAGNATDIDTVAANIAAVNNTSSNMAAVIDAPNQASAAAASAVSAANSAAAAATALDNFDDRYLGQKTADPTLDNDGMALLTGALYFNTTTGKMRVFTGSGWIDASSASVATLATFNYVATAGQTTFSGNDAAGVNLVYTVGAVIVTLNGIDQKNGVDYTATNGSSIVLTSAAAAGDELRVYAFGNFQVADTYSQAATNALLAQKMDKAGGTMTGALALPAGGLNVGSGQLAVDTSGRITIPYQPNFRAARSAGDVSAGNVVVYNSLINDTGGCFNTTNGRFTAPVSGRYIFDVYGLCNTASYAHEAQLRVNGSTVRDIRIHNSGASNQSALSGTTIIYLNASDYVDVNVSVGTLYGSGTAYNQFCGFFLG